MICNLCGKEFDSKRAMHGHLIQVHRTEYAAADYRQEVLTTDGEPPKKSKKKEQAEKTKSKRPAGFRLLNKKNQDELAAYNEGYRYIDNDDIVYDLDEAEREGWV